MRLFRTEQAARAAGLQTIGVCGGVPLTVFCTGGTWAEILTDREERLLKALDCLLDAVRAHNLANGIIAFDRHATEAAEALIRELAVEG